MKKILLILSIMSILFLVGCNSDEKIKNNDLSGESVENQDVKNNVENLATSFQKRTEEFDKIKKEIKESLVMTENGTEFAEKDIGDIVLEKVNDNYILDISVVTAISFEKSEIDAVIKNMEDNNLETAKLGDFTISKKPSEELKKRLDFMKENDIVGIELEIWEKYSDTNWLNENGVPVYIQNDMYDGKDYLWALEKNEDASSNKYYMLRIEPVGQDGLYRVLDYSNSSHVRIELLPNDKINFKDYGDESEDDYEIDLKHEVNATVEEYFNNNSAGDNHFIIKANNIKMVYDTIYLDNL